MQPGFYLPQGTRQMRLRRPSRLTVSVLLVLLISAAVLRAQTVNPAAYWTFDEGTGTVAHDSSGNNHDATLQGAATWTVGLVGPFALSLPGTPGSYADVPTAVVDTTHSYTVAAWVKLNNVNGYQTFVSEDGPEPTNPQSAFFLQLRGDSHQFSFTIPYSFFVNPQSGFTPVAGQWYHLAGVYDANARSASLYVNGVLADTIYRVEPRAAAGHTGIGHGQSAGSYGTGLTAPSTTCASTAPP